MERSEWLESIVHSRERLGKGAGRAVYDLGNNIVIKVPLPYTSKVKKHRRFQYYKGDARSRIAQNILELYVYQNCPEDLKYLLCPVIDYFFISDIPILFMPMMRVARDNSVRLKGKGKGRIRRLYGENRKDECEKFLADTERLADMFTLKKQDLYTPKHWGLTEDRRIKYIDYGYRDGSMGQINPEILQGRPEP